MLSVAIKPFALGVIMLNVVMEIVVAPLRHDYISSRLKLRRSSIYLNLFKIFQKVVNNCINTNIYSYLETPGACTINLFTAVIYEFS
jgi:hypothetical protein